MEIGARAVQVPYEITWEHEHVETDLVGDFVVLESLRELLETLPAHDIIEEARLPYRHTSGSRRFHRSPRGKSSTRRVHLRSRCDATCETISGVLATID